MKSMQSFSSRLSALLMLVFTFSSWPAHAEIVAARIVYNWRVPFRTLDAAGAQRYADSIENGKYADYYIYLGVRGRTEPQTLNGEPLSYSVWVMPTQKAVDELHIPPVEQEWQAISTTPVCPYGFDLLQYSGTGNINGPDFYAICYKPEPCEACEDKKANPVSVSTGAKTESALDYQGAPGLEFIRHYKSNRQGWSNNFAVSGLDIGGAGSFSATRGLYAQLPCVNGIDRQFKESYCFSQISPAFGKVTGTAMNEFVLRRGHSRLNVFGNSSNLNPPANINDRVSKVQDSGGNVTGWSVYNASNDSTEYFDLSGKLIKVVERTGTQKILTYSDASTPMSIAPKAGLLIRVTNHFGQQLNFTYDLQGRMSTMKDPAGAVTNYAYDEASSILALGAPLSGNLTSVTYPDNKKRIYWYNEQDKTGGANLPFALTGITDENGVRFATWTYDNLGRAISSEHAGGVEKYTFSGYEDYPGPTFVDPLGVSTMFGYTTILNQLQLNLEKRTAGALVSYKEKTFDANGNLSISPDFRGERTKYTYNPRNLETERIEAWGRDESQTTTTSWHANYRIPVQVNTPLLKTSYTHDTQGNVLTKTEQATSDTNGSLGASAPVVGNARTWTYTYNTIGQVLTVTGPRTDVVDKTTYTYDNLGNLSTVTNAAGHVTTL
ncbi:hypothetical protein ACO0LD_22260, partial [Undibacterium sp. Ji83W]